MRVLVNDTHEHLTVFDAREVCVDDEIIWDEVKKLNCPCIHIITEEFNIYIPMPVSEARSLVIEAYANDKVDLSSYYDRTYFNPDKDDMKELRELITSGALCLS